MSVKKKVNYSPTGRQGRTKVITYNAESITGTKGGDLLPPPKTREPRSEVFKKGHLFPK